MNVLMPVFSSAGTRISALSIRIWNWSQSSGSMPNSKSSGMMSLFHGFGFGLEAAHQQATDLLLEVDVAVGVAHHRQVARHVLHLLGDDVHVLAGIERHRDAHHAAELARPLARAIDDDLGRDRTFGGLHAGDAPVLGVDGSHAGFLENGKP